jgi:hypothetical protein
MRAPVPEELGDLYFIRATNGRLGRHHAHVVLAFPELPLSCNRRRLGDRQDDRLVCGLRFGRRLFDNLERFRSRSTTSSVSEAASSMTSDVSSG